jgi:hypothetical protein
MNKVTILLVAAFFGGICALRATEQPPKVDFKEVGDELERLNTDRIAQKKRLDAYDAALKELGEKLAANNQAAPAPTPASTPSTTSTPANMQPVAEKKHSDRYLWAMQQCPKFAAMSEHDQWVFDKRYARFTDKELTETIEDCKNPNRYRNQYYQRAVEQSQDFNPAAAAQNVQPAPDEQQVEEQPQQVAQMVYPSEAVEPGYGVPAPRRTMAYGNYGYQYRTATRARTITRTVETVPPELRSTSYRCNPDGSPASPGAGWCHRH